MNKFNKFIILAGLLLSFSATAAEIKELESLETISKQILGETTSTKTKKEKAKETVKKEVTKKEFKARMKFTSLYVFSESANFYFDDGDLFWGHTIEVNVNQNLEFTDTNIVG